MWLPQEMQTRVRVVLEARLKVASVRVALETRVRVAFESWVRVALDS